MTPMTPADVGRRSRTNTYLSTEQAVAVVRDWSTSHRGDILWSPDAVQTALLTASKGGRITFQQATTILHDAASSKMVPTANVGMGRIMDAWRKLVFRA